VHILGDWLTSSDRTSVRWHGGARSIVERSEIQAAGVASVKDALRLLPGILTTDNAFAAGGQSNISLGVRGLEGRLSPRTTVLLDGLPMSFAPYGQPQLSLAPVLLGNLQRVDLVRGGGSVRYGPQNVGGIINFVTRDIPADGSATSIRLRLDQSRQGGTQGSGDLFTGQQFESGTGIALLAGFVDGPGYRENSNERLRDVAVKLRHALNEDIEVSAKVHGYTASASLPGGINAAQYDADPLQSVRSHDRFQGRREGVDARWLQQLGGQRELDLRLFHVRSFRTTHLANNDDAALTTLDHNPRHYRTSGIEGRYSARVGGEGLDQVWSVGYRFITEDGQEERLRFGGFGTGGDPGNATTRVKDRDFRNETHAHAAFVDDRIRVGAWTVTPGLRVERVEISSRNLITGAQGELHYSEPLPSINVTYELRPDWQLFGNLNSSFGTVQFGQLNLSGTTALTPEKARTAELGTRYNAGGLTLDADVYLLRFNNQIDSDTVAGVTTFFNRGRTFHRGLELAGRADLERMMGWAGWSAFVNYAYTRATLEAGADAGNDLPFYSRHAGSVGAGLQQGDWQHQLTVTAQSKQFTDLANTEAEPATGRNGRIPGWAALNWRSAHAWKLEDGKSLELAAGARNLLDRQYFGRSTDTNGGKLAGAPRTLFVEMSLSL
jgi:Fe(3+) dicitrate transport protein